MQHTDNFIMDARSSVLANSDSSSALFSINALSDDDLRKCDSSESYSGKKYTLEII